LHTARFGQSEAAGSAGPAFKRHKRALPDRGNAHLFSSSRALY
jgi:hypothetical protein